MLAFRTAAATTTRRLLRVLAQWSRPLSSPPKEVRVLTPEEVQHEMDRVESHKKFLQSSPYPKTMIPGPSHDLHVLADPSEIKALSGMPQVHKERRVKVAPRFLNTMQSGTRTAHQWEISWPASERWSNPLTGWTSTADPHGSMKLSFNSKEEAVAFAEKNGWAFDVAPPVSPQCYPDAERNYSQNFLNPRVAEVVAMDGKHSKEFSNPKYGASNWFMPLTYHGDAEVEQHGPRTVSKQQAKK